MAKCRVSMPMWRKEAESEAKLYAVLGEKRKTRESVNMYN